ncbi:unnamed protein product [Closterium sp. NIES-65]|nr:unnamed protein product [Closterium sp. NIES-65]
MQQEWQSRIHFTCPPHPFLAAPTSSPTHTHLLPHTPSPSSHAPPPSPLPSSECLPLTSTCHPTPSQPPPSPFPPVFPSIPQRHMGAGSNEAAARANQAEGGGASGVGLKNILPSPSPSPSHLSPHAQGAMQRRVLAGLTEVGQAVCSGRAKCVVLAPNVEEVPGAGNMWRGEEGEEDGRVLIWRIQGGLAAALASIISTNTILVAVALSRCRLAKVEVARGCGGLYQVKYGEVGAQHMGECMCDG